MVFATLSNNLVVLEKCISVRLKISAFMSSVKQVAESPLPKKKWRTECTVHLF
jgi:hypothetical protein